MHVLMVRHVVAEVENFNVYAKVACSFVCVGYGAVYVYFCVYHGH